MLVGSSWSLYGTELPVSSFLSASVLLDYRASIIQHMPPHMTPSHHKTFLIFLLSMQSQQIANICWTIEKAREFQINFCFIDYTKAFDCVDHNKLWKILKEMEILDNLTCLLRNLYAGQEATVRTWNNGLVQNWERSTSRLYIITLLI